MPELNSKVYMIERASWRDLLALSALEKACFERDAWPLLDVMGVLTFLSVVRMRAMGDGELIGFIAGDPNKEKKTAWILTLGVLPDWRRMGIAETLLRMCEEEMHMPLVKLTVRRSNAAAIRLYEKFGYTQVDIWPKYYRGGEDGLVLAKEMTWV
ncbi:MAG: N-acetyltransferase [Pelolinea sp.]|nr:N-acetyltransferase [Pelolinea sp.]